MGIDAVRAFLSARAPDITVIDQASSTATVLEAAAALGVAPGQIAKTLSLRVGDRVALVVASDEARLDNRKEKEALGARPRLLASDEVERSAYGARRISSRPGC